MDVEIRPEREIDFDAIDRVVADAFGSAVEAQLVRDIRSSELHRPSTTLVALVEDEVVGHVMISGCALRGPDVSQVVAMLAPLAVNPDQQREGIGGQLTRAACAIADADGEPMVVLQGDPRYYVRFGFEPSVPLGITMDLPDWAPPEAAQVLRLASWNESISGHVELPAAFDGLD